MATIRNKGLGRGLSALIQIEEDASKGPLSLGEVSVDEIFPNPDQPRRDFDQESLDELAQSIREIGIVQPITLRKIEDNKYQIIAGERRYRASLAAGLSSVPAYIKTASDEQVMEMALIENIQREDLNAIEIALSYQRLLSNKDLTQEQLSERIGKKRTTISNYLRLLKLPAEIQIGLKNKVIEMGHARALISIEDPALQIRLFEEIVKHNYSVRQVEALAKDPSFLSSSASKKGGKNIPSKEDIYGALEKQLVDFLKLKVSISCNPKGKGALQIKFNNEQEFERIIELLDSLKK